MSLFDRIVVEALPIQIQKKCPPGFKRDANGHCIRLNIKVRLKPRGKLRTLARHPGT